MDIQALDQAILELQQQRAEAEKAAKEEGNEVYRNFKPNYDYTVTWRHPAQFRIERKATRETLDRINEFKEKYPLNNPPMVFEGGMTYSVLEGGYVLGGGGSVVVDFEKPEGYYSSFDPQTIEPDVLQSIRDGIVPDKIKRG